MHSTVLIGAVASTLFASMAAANGVPLPHPGMGGMGGMMGMHNHPPHHCSNAGFINNNQAGFNNNKFGTHRPMTLASWVPNRHHHSGSGSNNLFSNVEQKPSVVQVQDSEKKHPHHHNHYGNNQHESPVVANYRTESYNREEYPEYDRPCKNRYYAHQRPHYPMSGYDGCFGPEEDGDYREFLALGDYPCGCGGGYY